MIHPGAGESSCHEAGPGGDRVLGNAYFKKGVPLCRRSSTRSLQYLLKAKDYNPKNGYIYYNLAEAYLFQKKYPEAEKALIQASELMPQTRRLSGGWVLYMKSRKNGLRP